MKLIMLINIISIFLGVAAIFYKDINYSTGEKLMDIGLIQASPETKRLS